MPTKTTNTDRLRAMADKLRSDAADKLRPRDTHTAKKLSQARSAERDGMQYQRAAVILDAYCDACERDQLPAVLRSIKPTKDTFLLAAKLEGAHVSNGYHGYVVDTAKPHDASEVSTALRTLAERNTSPDDVAAQNQAARRIQITRAMDEVRGGGIDGFFPTPSTIAAQMVAAADLRAHHRVLEPSAGMGCLVDAVRASGFTGEIDAVELHRHLCGILETKGIAHHCHDFLDWRKGGYDRILMNPPYERRQAIKHIEHAFSLLAPGGVIVALLPTNHAAELQFPGMRVTQLPANSFNTREAFRRTGVSVAMVRISKPAAHPVPGSAPVVRTVASALVSPDCARPASPAISPAFHFDFRPGRGIVGARS